MEISINLKKFWYADVAADGGMGTNWKEIQQGERQGTVQFNGSAADRTTHKNVLGNALASSLSKGDKTINFQLADLTPDIIADFTGGISSTSASAESYDAALNENQAIEKSIMFLSDSNVLYRMARVAFDGYPMMNDDDLHYYQMDGLVLQPEKNTVSSYGFDILLLPDANDITAFSLAEQTGAATIDDVAHTVAIEVETGTSVTALVPTIVASLGASVTPNSGAAQDFTNPVVYSVESANGGTQAWTVTVTVAV